MINYFFEFSLLLFTFTVFYLLIKNKSNYGILRKYIFLSIIISLGAPLLPHFGSSPLSLGEYGVLLPELLIQPESHDFVTISPWSFPWLAVAGWGIKIVSFTLLMIFIYSIIKLFFIIKNGLTSIEKDYKVVTSKSVKNPCSFFDYILLPEGSIFSEHEKAAIIRHEALHIKYKHSREKLLLEVARIFLWWHPSLWYFKREIDLLHEYQVDDKMIHIMNPKSYRDILLQLIIHPPGLRMTNPLSSHIKKRFLMMNQNKKQFGKVTSLMLAIALISSAFFIHACQSDETTSISATEDKTKNVLTQTWKETETKAVENSNLYTFTRIDTTVIFDPETMHEDVVVVRSEVEAYSKPDVMPLFPGSTDQDDSQQKLLEYLYKNLKYPEEARINSIEGVAVLQFVVTNDGYLTDLKIVKDVDGGCGESAFKVLKDLRDNSIEKWTPGLVNGENVNVKYVVPVKFKLQ